MTDGRLVSVFVADDEAPARRKVLRFLSRDPEVSVVGEASDGRDTIAGVRVVKPNLLFLDVQMPDMDGFEVIRALGMDVVPRVVFVTAHDEYAIRAFEVHAFGYLLKPFDSARFSKVLADAKQQIEKDSIAEVGASMRELLAQMQRRVQPTARLLVEQNGRGFFLALNEIDWAESERNYVKLHVGTREYVIRGTIERLSEKLDPSGFLRINRSCLIRIEFVRELQNWTHGEYRVVLQSGEVLTWTRRYLNQHPQLLQRL